MSSFVKEEILPATNAASPFYRNLPAPDSKPIDDLIFYFKCWKKFIKSLIYYLKEVALVKEFNSKINLQLVNSVLFPGVMNLPMKYMADITSTISTPPKEVKKNLSSNSLANLSHGNHSASDLSTQTRPNLFKSKSNQSFLKPKHFGTAPSFQTSKENTNGSGTPSDSPTPSNANSSNTAAPASASASASGLAGNSLTPVSTNTSFKEKNGHNRNISLGSLSNFSFDKKQQVQAKFQSPQGKQQGSQQSLQQLQSHQQSPSHEDTSQVKTKHYDDINVPKSFFNQEVSLFSNLPHILINDHYHAYLGEVRTYKEINGKLIARLESLLKNLSLKIKEIKTSLKNESFANESLVKEISETGKLLNGYMVSIERYSNPDKPVLKKSLNDDDEEFGVLDDPFLLKLQLDYQLKTQLVQENYGFASYLNLQTIAKDLSNYVLKDLKVIANKFGKLLDQESCYNDQSITALYNQLVKITSASKPEDEWNFFIANNQNFININPNVKGTNPYRHSRTFSGLQIPYASSIHNKCIRNGMIYKKSKILKNYNANYYILTCNYLHEYKIPESSSQEGKKDHKKDGKKESKREAKSKIGGIIGPHDIPEKSYNLNDYILKPKNNDKFILQSIRTKSKKFTFKCANDQEFNNWWTDLSEVLKFGPNHIERFEFVESKIRSQQPQQRSQPVSGSSSASGSKPASLHSNTTSPVSTPSGLAPTFKMQLNLDGLKNEPKAASDNGAALNAMFTPRIHTPQPLDEHGRKIAEQNPFESTFGVVPVAASPAFQAPSTPDGIVHGSNSALQSPAQSPVMTPQSPTPSTVEGIVDSRGSTPVPILVNGESDEVFAAHENYLKIQQDFLRKQQSLLDKKIKENEFQQEIHRESSGTSLNSLVPQSNINQLLDGYPMGGSGNNSSNNRVDLESKESSSSIPTVLISSNH